MRGPSRVVVIASSTLLIGAPAAIACSPQDYMSPEEWQALSPAQQAENTLGHTHEGESPPLTQGSDPAPAADAGPAPTEGTRSGAPPEPNRDSAAQPAGAGLPANPQQAASFVRQGDGPPKLPEELRAATPRSSTLVVRERRAAPRRTVAPAASQTPAEQPSIASTPAVTPARERTVSPTTQRPASDERGAERRPRSDSAPRRTGAPSRSDAAPNATVERERSTPSPAARDAVPTAAPSTPAARGATDFWPLALIVLAVSAIAGVLARRRSDGDSAAVETTEPPLPPDAVEAELQEILAERHAESLGADHAAPDDDQRDRAAVGESPTATNSA